MRFFRFPVFSFQKLQFSAKWSRTKRQKRAVFDTKKVQNQLKIKIIPLIMNKIKDFLKKTYFLGNKMGLLLVIYKK